MLEQIDGKIGEHLKLRLETAAAKADRIVSEELGGLNWKETDLRSRRKSAPAKLVLAARLRRETTLWIKAIASRVHLGTSKSAKIRLHAVRRLTALRRVLQFQSTLLTLDPQTIKRFRWVGSVFQKNG